MLVALTAEVISGNHLSCQDFSMGLIFLHAFKACSTQLKPASCPFRLALTPISRAGTLGFSHLV